MTISNKIDQIFIEVFFMYPLLLFDKIFSLLLFILGICVRFIDIVLGICSCRKLKGEI